jgi:hypothetical protein
MVSPPSTLIEIFHVLGLILVAAIGGYTAYWSLAIRQALRVRIYRRQLLWVGLTSLFAMYLLITYYFVGPEPFIPSALASNPYLPAFNSVSFVLFPVILLLWADSNIQVARRSDPLLRDPFRWNRTRILLWGIAVLGVLIISVTALSPPYPRITDQDISSVLGYSLGFSLQYLVLAVAAAPLLIGSRRSGDENFRRSLRWYGIAVALVVAGTFGNFLLVEGNPLTDTTVNFAWGLSQNIIWVLAVISIYKCARSLVPLSRISLTAPD